MTLAVKICGVAVPTFMALSGYLFFRNCNEKSIWQKWRRRVHSILVPWLFWNTFFYFLYLFLNRIPFVAERINFEIPQFGLKAFVWNNMINPPMWFLLSLFVLQCAAPAVLILFRRFERYNLLWISGLAAADLVIGFYDKSALHYAAVFFMGGYMAYFHSASVELSDRVRETSVWKKILAGSVLIIVNMMAPQWLCAPVLVWFLVEVSPMVKVRPFMRSAFFIMCTHYFFVRVVRKVFYIIFGGGAAGMVWNIIFTFLTVVILLSMAAGVLRKLAPRIFLIICGGR